MVSAFQATELAMAEPSPDPLPLSVLLEAVEAAFITRPAV
jgi:hypothetical protein